MSPSNWDHGCCSAANRADPLWPTFPIIWGKGDTNKLITALTQRMKNEPPNSVLRPRG